MTYPYPSMNEILAEKPEIIPEIIQTVQKWKETEFNGWPTFSNSKKLNKLRLLMEKIIPTLNYSFENAFYYACNRQNRIIYSNQNNPSIISSLHEVGHALFGPSELKACRFSIWIFKDLFPKSFNKLKTDKHMLKNP